MSKRLTLLLLAALVVPQALHGQDARPGVAVMAFSNGGSYGDGAQDLSALEVGLQQMLLTELAQNEALRIVERSLLRSVLEEQDLAAEGRVDARTAAGLGKLVGARYMITGAFTDSYGEFRIDARIVDVETGEIIQSREVRDSRENLYQLLVTLASEVMADVELEPLPASVRQSRGAREIPLEAVTIYATAQALADDGALDQAVELYRQLMDRFPQMVEAAEALRAVAVR